MEVHDFDFVVVGSGLAGLIAAYHASKHGNVALISKSVLDVSNSYLAQGGIAAVITEADSPEDHIQDTLIAGRGLCDYDAVEILVKEGRERVREFIDLGMKFDTTEDGQLLLGLEGGHHKRRILHAGGDATGREMTSFMVSKVSEIPNIKTFEYTAAVKLLVRDGFCHGIQALRFPDQKNLIFRSNATILATGGLSRLFSRSTNPHTATGDGIALAFEAGATLADMEFIQFHPSALYIPNKDAFLISEAVRGEGAYLINYDGKRFMKNVHPLAELAPRDVVAYNIFKEIEKSGKPNVFLSLSHLDANHINNRFKSIIRKLNEYGIDLTTDKIPVAPAAHYMVGGIRTDLHAQTNIKGLYACGELASTGVMGANRLASNSLLECLVFSKRAIDSAANTIIKHKPKTFQPSRIILDPENDNLFLEYKNKVAGLLTRNVGIVRRQDKLEEARKFFSDLAMKFPPDTNSYNLIKIRQMAEIGEIISQCALERKETRGGHIREDFREENPRFRYHSLIDNKKELIHTPVKD